MKNLKKLTVALMLALGSTFAMTSCGDAEVKEEGKDTKSAPAKAGHSEADHSEAAAIIEGAEEMTEEAMEEAEAMTEEAMEAALEMQKEAMEAAAEMQKEAMEAAGL